MHSIVHTSGRLAGQLVFPAVSGEATIIGDGEGEGKDFVCSWLICFCSFRFCKVRKILMSKSKTDKMDMEAMNFIGLTINNPAFRPGW